MNPLSNKRVLDGIDNSIKSIELETVDEQSYLKVKDLMGRTKYVSSKGLVTKIEDAIVIGGVSPEIIEEIQNVATQVEQDKVQTGLDVISAKESADLAEQYKNEIQTRSFNDSYAF